MNVEINSGTQMVAQLISAEFAAEIPTESQTLIPAESELRALSMYLRSLRTFFNIRNHPLSDTEAAEVWTRDFIHETRIVGEMLRQSSRFCVLLVPHSESLNLPGVNRSAVCSLSEALADLAALCNALATAPQVSFETFAALGNLVKRMLDHSPAASDLAQVYSNLGVSYLQKPLQKLLDELSPDKLNSDVRRIFVDLARLIDYLRWIESALQADRPLKHTLGVFTLLHEEARGLQDLIDKRALRGGEFEGDVFDALDSTAYAIDMELRKVFGHELIGLSMLKEAPLIYVKVEQAHGLLSNCFQQSTVALAQLFAPSIDGKQLFHSFQNRLEQSIDLCRDLWRLLKFVRHASNERDRYPVSSFKSRLGAFREGSLRFLMYKDWETYERFAQEIGGARGAVELAPVLHRFDCYLETLLGQVRMRAVLADQPLDFLADESLS